MRVGKKFYFDGVGGESAGGQLAKRGNEGQLLESLFGTRLGSSALLHSDRLNINCPKTEKRRVQGGFSDPEHRTAAGTFLAIEEGGADFSFGNSGFAGVGSFCFAEDMAVVSVGCTASLGHWRITWRGAGWRGWIAGHRNDVEFASLIHPS